MQTLASCGPLRLQRGTISGSPAIAGFGRRIFVTLGIPKIDAHRVREGGVNAMNEKRRQNLIQAAFVAAGLLGMMVVVFQAGKQYGIKQLCLAIKAKAAFTELDCGDR